MVIRVSGGKFSKSIWWWDGETQRANEYAVVKEDYFERT